MKKIVAILFVGMMLLTTVGCQKKEENITYQSPREEDLMTMVKTLDSKHKNLYAKISKEEFQVEVDKIKENLEKMSEAEFYYSLCHLLTLVGDAHTSIGYSQSKYGYEQGLPFAIAKFEDGWRVMILEEEYKDYLGYKIVGINDVTIEEVYEKSKAIIPHENDAWIDSNFSNTINFKEALEYLKVVQKDEDIILKLKSDDQQEIQIPLRGLTEEEIMSIPLARFEREHTPTTYVTQDIYRFLPLTNETLFIQYNSCQEDPNLSMKEFTKQVKTELEANQYNTIVIDLRYNSGGNSSIINPLLTMLKDKEATFYTLIGPNTFSSGIMNAIDTQESLNSTLVGLQTGGNVNGYGEIKFVQMKNEPFSYTYSTKYFELIKGYDKDSLYPDIDIAQNYESYQKGLDAEVEWILANNQ